MRYTRLGNSGLQVSRLCFGTNSVGRPGHLAWVMGEDEARPLFAQALEAGITFFDTADIYSNGVSEEVTGKLLRELAPRDEIVLATKVHGPMGDKPTQQGLSRKHIMDGIDASLGRLGMDHVDLYVIHRWDDETPIEETMQALDDVVRAGKARYIGASTMFAWQFAKAQAAAERNGWHRFVSMQNYYNLIYREEEREMIPLCLDQGVGVTPWSPLARGFLAGNRHRQGGGDTVRAKADQKAHRLLYTDNAFAIADAVAEVAAERGVKPIQVALAWMLHKPGIAAPVVGVSNADQLVELVGAVDVEVSAEEIARLEAPYEAQDIKGMD